MDQLFAGGSVDPVTDFTFDYAAGSNARANHSSVQKHTASAPHLRNLVQMQSESPSSVVAF
jgi:hypothetical protein